MNIFDVQQPSTFSADLTLHTHKLHVEVNVLRSKSGKNWQCEVEISSDASPATQKTKPIVLGVLQNMAVIGVCLRPEYHRPNEQIIDIAAFLDRETVAAIDRLGENTICTLTQIGQHLQLASSQEIAGSLKTNI